MHSSFDIKLIGHGPLDKGGERPVTAAKLISCDALQKLASKECVNLWNLPLSALQRKIGENGRFCLPTDLAVIDNPLAFAVIQYFDESKKSKDGLPALDTLETLDVHYVREKPIEQDEDNQNDKAESHLPMKEKDWDYVFQANAILNCSMIDIASASFEKAPLAGFRIRNADEDDAELPMPLDDDRAKVPTWCLSTKPGRTYMIETNYELEQSAVESSSSKESWNIGLGATFKDVGGTGGDISGEGKYGRSKESVFKDSRSYGKKSTRMNLVHEIPTVEVSLHRGNTRLSDGCRQALLRIRAEKQFDDLMRFFENYGTIYAKRVVLGGRLLSTQKYDQASYEQTVTREKTMKENASLSLDIIAISVSGGYSNERNFASTKRKKETVSQATIDWRSYGGNAAYTSKPDEWLKSLSDFRYWEVIENAEVEPIQDFIGSLPGFEDIPGVFDSILRSGLYDPYILRLCQGQRPVPMPSPQDTLNPVLGNVHTLSGKMSAVTAFSNDITSSSWHAKPTVTVRGGASWRVLDGNLAIEQQLVSTIQTVTNTGTNLRSAPAYFYEVSMQPKSVTVILEWSSDTVRHGLQGSVGRKWPGYRNPSLEVLNTDDIKALTEAINKLSIDLDTTPGDWDAQAELVTKKLEAVQLAIQRDSPFSDWLAKRVGIWLAAKADYKDYITSKNQQVVDKGLKLDTLVMLKDILLDILRTHPVDDEGLTFSQFTLNDEALKLLNNDNAQQGAQAFIDKFGHRYIQGYSEVGRLTAIWSLSLPEGTEKDEVERFRLRIQRYFVLSRSIEEACDFFTQLSYEQAKGPSIKATVIGFRNPRTGQAEEHALLDPSQVKQYLTEDALNRNQIRTLYELQPYRGLDIKWNIPGQEKQKTAFELIQDPLPAEQLIVNLADIEKQLFILNAYAKLQTQKVASGRLKVLWKRFNVLEGPSSMTGDGKITPEALQNIWDLQDEIAEAIKDAKSHLPHNAL